MVLRDFVYRTQVGRHANGECYHCAYPIAAAEIVHSYQRPLLSLALEHTPRPHLM
jgi:hypothetical protein